MTNVEFQTLASGIQSIAVTIAAIVGGIWAIYRFWSLRELTKAEAEIESLRRSLRERGTIKVALTTKNFCEPTSKAKYVLVRAEYSNVGSRPEVLDWKVGRLWSARLSEIKDGIPLFDNWTQSFLVDHDGLTIASVLAPGEINTCEFLVPTPSAGIYLLDLQVPGSAEETYETMQLRAKLGDSSGSATWAAMAWICVP